MNISDRGNDIGRTGIIIDENGVSGLGGATGTGTIQYSASGTFNGGMNLYLGAGDDGVTVLGASDNTVTTLRTGGGDDQVVLRNESAGDDGLVVVFGEAGSDTLDGHEWDNDLILVGDEGETSLSASMRAENLTEVVAVAGSDDGDDTLIGGTGDDVIVGGMGDDELHGGAGDDQLIGDLGRVSYLAGKVAKVESFERNVGGDDLITGDAGDDVVIGGMGADALYGNDGNDAIIGDAGRVTYQSGTLYQVENTQFFTGGNDLLDGGDGNDILFGGFGHDTFYGTFEDDIMLGEEGRLTLKDGSVESIVRLGQSPQDLIASTQEQLYTSDQPAISAEQNGEPLAVETQIFATTMPAVSVEQRERQRYHHAGSHVVPQQQKAVEGGDSAKPVEDQRPAIPDESGLEPKMMAPEVPAPSSEQPQGKQLDQLEEPVGEVQDSAMKTLRGAVVGFTGWGVAAGQRKSSKKRLESEALHRFGQPQARNWRWQEGRLQQDGKTPQSEWEKPLVKMATFNTKTETVETQRNR